MASTVPPFAFVVPASFSGVNATQLGLSVSVTAGDGVDLPICYGTSYTWDLTQPFATNVANLKQCIVESAADFGIALQSSQVSVFTAVD